LTDNRQLRQKVAGIVRNLDVSQLLETKVVTMPDFSLDHTLYVDDFEQFLQEIRTVMQQGGGELPSIRQSLNKGGCATLVASGLDRFGIQSYIIGRTSPIGHRVLESFLRGSSVNIEHVRIDGNLGLMTILEIGSEKHNIMIGDPDSMSPFGFNDLTAEDLTLLRSSALVGIFDWVYNRRGTDLAKEVFAHVKAEGVTTYLDVGDPSPRLHEIEALFTNVICSKNLDVVSLNENEINHIAHLLLQNQSYTLLEKASYVKRCCQARLDIHCAMFSASLEGDQITVLPTFDILPYRTTGAGDSWNAANIFADILQLPSVERLLIANAVAGFYVASDTGSQSSLEELSEFIEYTPLRSDNLERFGVDDASVDYGYIFDSS
jgi:sugar/nucleoside kinase (ribokinase family)